MIFKICLYCKKEFPVDYKSAIYCSPTCRQKAYYYRNHEEVLSRLKISRNKPEFQEKRKEYQKSHREHHTKYYREYNKNQEHRAKRKIRQHAYKRFKKKLLKEFKEKCAYCGSTENLEVHHLKYEKDINSCIILCRECHRNL